MQVDLLEPDLPNEATGAQPPALLPPPERAAVALNTRETEAKLRAAVEKHKGITEIKDKAGREQAHGAAMELMRLRTSIGNKADEVRDDAKKFNAAVLAEEKRLITIVEPEEKRLKALRDAWDQAEARRKEEEARIERARKAAIAEKIADIKSYRELAQQARTSAMVQSLIDGLTEKWANVDAKAVFEEFADDAGVAYRVTLQHMEATLKQKRDAEAEAERQRVERERLAEERRQQEADAARLAAEREAFERERAVFAEQQRLAAEKEAWEAKWGGLHPNGAPMYSRTTFKDNGEPIMLDADGKRSVFCDLGDSDGTAESMVDLSDVAQVQPVDSRVVEPFKTKVVMRTTYVKPDADPVPGDVVELGTLPAGTVIGESEEEEASVIAGFDEAMNAPIPEQKPRNYLITDVPRADDIVHRVAQAFGVDRTTAIDWLVIRADDILNLGDEVQA